MFALLDTALAAVTEQLEGMKVHADTALAAVTEQLEGMKVADERRVEVLTRRQEWREELTAQQAVVSLATRMQAAARGLLTRAALRRINTLVSPVRRCLAFTSTVSTATARYTLPTSSVRLTFLSSQGKC